MYSGGDKADDDNTGVDYEYCDDDDDDNYVLLNDDNDNNSNNDDDLNDDDCQYVLVDNMCHLRLKTYN